MIRKSWGSHGISGISLVFLVGRGSKLENVRVFGESGLLKDMVLYDFRDKYEYLTYKSLVGLQWAVSFCREAVFIGKVDDDVFLNVFLLRDLIKEKTSEFDVSATPIVIGRPNQLYKVLRSAGNKWMLNHDEFSPEIYPDYASGLTYYVNRAYALKTLKMTRNQTLLKIEDVYVTGVLREIIGVNLTSFLPEDGMFVIIPGFLKQWFRKMEDKLLAVIMQEFEGLLAKNAFYVLKKTHNSSEF